jgi:hypothetical protein
MAERGHATGANPVQQPKSSQNQIPPAAKLLGGLGAIPFICLGLASLVLEDANRQQVAFALVVYGALILSFLGGIHWGLAIAGFGPDQVDNATFRRLAWSVVPSLIGWCALLLLPREGLPVLAAAFILLFLFDLYASRQGEAPAWYPNLRWPLTMAVVAALLAGALA